MNVTNHLDRKMSTTSKIVLSGATIISVSIISYVHFKQQVDRAKLHEGVVRDIERQQRRKTENIYLLQKQTDLTRQLKQSDPGYMNER